ncbi:MAG: hypothetical protein FMNOHCHN_03910 [Ignavibacteriaceae bacterium]|nr:hypothetical protein [Ignavibacteriaceae bacterium]
MKKYHQQILRHNRSKYLGYESTLDFNYGYISALLSNKLISRKEYNKLLKELADAN